jgi:hypothetical protein
MNFIAQFKTATQVPIPEVGYGSVFLDSNDGGTPKVKLSDNTIVNLDGNTGWSPIINAEVYGEKYLFKIVGWTGGEGTPPSLTGYFTATGISPNVGDALNYRGPQGSQGSSGITLGEFYVTFDLNNEQKYCYVVDANVSAANPPMGLTVLQPFYWDLSFTVAVETTYDGAFVAYVYAMDINGHTLTGIQLPPMSVKYFTQTK